MTNKNDPHWTAQLEKEIAQQYGKETIQHPLANWDINKESEYLRQLKESTNNRIDEDYPVELEEVRGVLIPKKLVTRESNRTCPSCNVYSFNTQDDLFMSKFDVCEKCYILHIEGREEKWKKNLLKKTKNNSKQSSEKS